MSLQKLMCVCQGTGMVKYYDRMSFSCRRGAGVNHQNCGSITIPTSLHHAWCSSSTSEVLHAKAASEINTGDYLPFETDSMLPMRQVPR
ncbi:hypothetical protein CEXT_793961 [Caerostris extrusa]|uniref:Uncharacterized protein n=1 Tax=Caerostris extrusa TaxID=172846 RepID=A0AAV4MUN9_CAEEX|nr:hypothetical protein CEXT_793961 [Caerostris extrusa]